MCIRKWQIVLAWVALAAVLPAAAEEQTQDARLFQDIKVLIFDEQWREAEVKLDDWLARFPQSPLAGQALFYKARCLKEQGGRDRDALLAAKDFLRLKEQNRNLVEDAEVTVIDLAFKLAAAGDRAFLRDLEERLEHPNKTVRYYAAIQMSYLKDKKDAVRSVSVLKSILAEEKNAELRDRAKIALLRVAPDELARSEKGTAPRHPRVLHFEIKDEDGKKGLVSINIPWALADLALNAISEEDKRALRTKGYDIAKILKELQSSPGDIVEIRAEGKSIKIWLD